MRHRTVAIVDQLNRPPALVLDPHEYDAGAVARRQFLVRFVPLDQNHFGAVAAQIEVGALRKLGGRVLLVVGRGERDADGAAHVAGGQPTLLVVVDATQLPALVLCARPRKRDLFELRFDHQR